MTSIYDIAARVGVSGVTVSNVLSGKSRPTRPDAVARAVEIRRVAKQMGYRANTAARAARSGRFQRVGLVLPYRRSSYIPHRLTSGLTHALNERDYQLAISELPSADADPHVLPCMLRELSVDALISLTPGISASEERLLEEQGLPAVLANGKSPINAVYPDETANARLLTEYLLASGHRRIGYLDLRQDWTLTLEPITEPGPERDRDARRAVRRPSPPELTEHYSVEDRRSGYAQAMLDAGLRPDMQLVGGRDPDDRLANLTALLRRPDRPTAVVLRDESLAPDLLQAAGQVGLTVPRDLSIASFSWGGVWRAGMGLTCIRYDGLELAEEAAGMLFDRIADPDADLPSRTCPSTLIIDRTVRRYEEECSS